MVLSLYLPVQSLLHAGQKHSFSRRGCSNFPEGSLKVDDSVIVSSFGVTQTSIRQRLVAVKTLAMNAGRNARTQTIMLVHQPPAFHAQSPRDTEEPTCARGALVEVLVGWHKKDKRNYDADGGLLVWHLLQAPLPRQLEGVFRPYQPQLCMSLNLDLQRSRWQW